MLDDIGGILLESVEDACTATHVIATRDGEPLKRTPKLMIAMNTTHNIVTLDWLRDSAKAGKPLPSDNYLIEDREAEKKFHFSIQKAMQTIRRRVKEKDPVLKDAALYFCHGVAGNKAPEEDELKLIVRAAGGVWLKKPNESHEASHLVVITSNDKKQAEKQKKVKTVKQAIEDGASVKSAGWLFDTMMKQELDLDE